jgi:hypothetical protein
MTDRDCHPGYRAVLAPPAAGWLLRGSIFHACIRITQLEIHNSQQHAFRSKIDTTVPLFVFEACYKLLEQHVNREVPIATSRAISQYQPSQPLSDGGGGGRSGTASMAGAGAGAGMDRDSLGGVQCEASIPACS